MKAPWMKFYPSDWRSDPRLKVVSLEARGLWIEMLCLMHEASPRGHLLIGKSAVSPQQLSSMCATNLKTIRRCLAELEEAGVFDVENGIIVSRRMVRDELKAEEDRKNGKRGGNPTLKRGVNPDDKAQIPEARVQKPEKEDGAEAPSFLFEDGSPPPPAKAPNARVFSRCREILGAKDKDAGWIAKKLLDAKGNIPAAMVALEQAAGASEPKPYLLKMIGKKRSLLAGGTEVEWRDNLV